MSEKRPRGREGAGASRRGNGFAQRLGRVSSRPRSWPTHREILCVHVSGNPPVEWNEKKNIRWKTAIPGRGHASPIMWKDRIYVQTSEEMMEGGLLTSAVYRFKLLAIDSKDR